jgi:hypothetical protein
MRALVAIAVTLLLIAQLPSADASRSARGSSSSLEGLTIALVHGVDHGAAPARLASLAQDRAGALLAAMASDPARALRAALPDDVAAALPDGAPAEAAVDLEGTILLLHADGARRSIDSWRLATDGGDEVVLHFAAPTELQPGERARVTGLRLGQDMAVAAADGDGTGTVAAASAAAPVAKKVLVLMFKFPGQADPWSADAVRKEVFTGSSSANAYWTDSSFGLLSLTGNLRPDGDVAGPYVINSTNSACSSNYKTWSNAARAAAQADGWDLGGYDHFVYAFKSSGCPGSGWAYISASDSWVISMTSYVVAHELGHNFGLHHASSYRCTDGGVAVAISSACTASEYGDPFDVMGTTKRINNNFQKGRLGFFGSSNTVDATTSGVYTIAPVEAPTDAPQAVRVARTTSQSYYLEFRQPWGTFDSFAATDPVVRGVSLRLGPGYATLAKPLLLDATPSTSSFTDGALLADRWLYDAVKNITFHTLSVGPEGAQVEVTIGALPCTRAAPGVAVSPSSAWAEAGQTVQYTMTITNLDAPSCAAADFHLEGVLPEGWSQSLATSVVSLAPGASATVQVAVTSAADAAEALTTIVERAVHGADAGLVGQASASYGVRAPDTAPPSVAITNPKDGATLSAKGNQKITATASDASPIATLAILVDGTTLKVCSGVTSCTVIWSLTQAGAGAHTITAVATDASPAANQGQASISVVRA